MNTILITGGNGYLGSSIVKKLIPEYNVIVLERGQNQSRLKNCLKDITFFDISEDSLEKVFEKPIDILIHTATLYGRNDESNYKMLDANLIQPFLLLDIAIRNNVRTIINSDTILNRYTNSYALTKKQFADWLHFHSNQINIINFELEHFYGPGASETNFITMLVRKMILNEERIELTEGLQKRDFLYIDDLVKLFKFFVENHNSYKGYHSFEVGSGENYSIRSVVEKIHKITASDSKLIFGAIPFRSNEIMNSSPDLSALEKTNWKSLIGIDEGLNKIVEFEKNKLNNNG